MQCAESFEVQRADAQRAARAWRRAADPTARMASLQAYYHALVARRCSREERQVLVRDLFTELQRGAMGFFYQVLLFAEVNEARASAVTPSEGG
jgi:hypothetical protein